MRLKFSLIKIKLRQRGQSLCISSLDCVLAHFNFFFKTDSLLNFKDKTQTINIGLVYLKSLYFLVFRPIHTDRV